MTPHVTCVCLTADRQAHTERAVKCFLAQTYPNKSLLILDTGAVPFRQSEPIPDAVIFREKNGPTIGALRNAANAHASGGWLPTPDVLPDIIAHWDSDDWSHPLRLAWQVQHLKDTTAELVGYTSMIFWREGEAWRYSDETPHAKLIGTSFCYWRRTWEQKPFRDVNRGEDNDWQKGLTVRKEEGFFKDEPAMIASILPGGAGGWYDDPALYKSPNWQRVPDWDAKIRRLMA